MNVNLLEKLWKAVARGDFELDQRGLVVPPLGVAANGVYEHWVNDEAHQFDHNTTSNEGLIYLLVTGLLNGSKFIDLAFIITETTSSSVIFIPCGA